MSAQVRITNRDTDDAWLMPVGAAKWETEFSGSGLSTNEVSAAE